MSTSLTSPQFAGDSRLARLGDSPTRRELALTLATLALPMLGEQILNFLIGFVDTYLAGEISREATAAVGTGAYFGWFLTLAFALVNTGVAALVSRAFGAGDRATANRVLGQGFALGFAVGVVLSLAVFFAADQIARQFMVETSAAATCAAYLRIDALSYVFASLTFVGAAALRAAGDTRTPMRIMAAVSVINAVVSAALVYGWVGLKLGVVGIALGTMAARTLGGLMMLAVLLRGAHGLKLAIPRWRPDREIMRRMLRIGIPGATDAFFLFAAQILFLKIVAHSAIGAQATVNYATHVIAVRLEAISFLPATAWMTAATTLLGQALGARRPETARRAGHVAAMLSLTTSSLVGLIFATASGLIYRNMSEDADVRALGRTLLPYMGMIQPLLGLGIVYAGALRGVGDTRFTMGMSLLSSLGVRVLLAGFGVFFLNLGLLGAWLGMFGDNLVRCFISLGRFIHGGWQRIRV